MYEVRTKKVSFEVPNRPAAEKLAMEFVGADGAPVSVYKNGFFLFEIKPIGGEENGSKDR